MAGGIFNPEHGIYRMMEKLVDVFLLSVFWLVCSIPLFTLGPATAALYHTVVRCLRGDERNSWAVFFRVFRENFKVGVQTSLAVLAAGAVLFVLQRLLSWTAAVGPQGVVVYYAYCTFLMLVMGMGCYLFPVLSRFTFRTGGLICTCAKLAIAHLPTTVGLAALLYLALFACWNLFPLICLAPVITTLLQSLLLERVFAPYIQSQREEKTM